MSVCCPLFRNAELDFNGDAPDDIEMFDEVRNTEPQVATLTYVSCWIVKWDICSIMEYGSIPYRPRKKMVSPLNVYKMTCS